MLSERRYNSDNGCGYHSAGHHPLPITGGICMQVVLVKSPKALRGFLRMIFGIKKEESVS